MPTVLSKLRSIIHSKLPKSELLDLGDFSLWVNLEDEVITPFIKEQRTWEPFETNLLRNLIKPADIVLDVGANIGYYAVLFSRWIGRDGLVFAIDPDPRNCAFLRQNLALNKCDNVIPIEAAASDRNGTLNLYLSRDNKGDHRAYDSKDGRETLTVSCLRLGDLPALSVLRRDRRMFIKMDIQGYEPYALAGVRPLIERFQSVQLALEFWPIGLIRAGVDPKRWLEELLDDRWDIYNIDHNNKSLYPVKKAQRMIDIYPPETEWFTNLLCVERGTPLPPEIPSSRLEQ